MGVRLRVILGVRPVPAMVGRRLLVLGRLVLVMLDLGLVLLLVLLLVLDLGLDFGLVILVFVRMIGLACFGWIASRGFWAVFTPAIGAATTPSPAMGLGFLVRAQL